MKPIYDQILNKDLVSAKKEIHTKLYEKIGALIDNRKVEIAQTMFNEKIEKIDEGRVERLRRKGAKYQSKANKTRAKSARLAKKKNDEA